MSAKNIIPVILVACLGGSGIFALIQYGERQRIEQINKQAKIKREMCENRFLSLKDVISKAKREKLSSTDRLAVSSAGQSLEECRTTLSAGSVDKSVNEAKIALLLNDYNFNRQINSQDKLNILEELVRLGVKENSINEINELRKKVRIEKEIKEARLKKEIAQKQDEERKFKKSRGVLIGMSHQDVIDSSWGRPDRTTTYQTANGVTEYWHYGRYSERGVLMFVDGTLTLIQN